MAAWRETFARLFDGGRTKTRTLRGVPVTVLNTRPDIDTARVFSKIDGALGVIERYQPHRLRRFRRDVAGIVVQRFACRAAFFPDSRAVLIELTFAGRGEFSDAQVAASMVHEGVHARLLAMGVAGCPGREAREERLCREAELELGLAAADQAVVERALASLALSDEDVAPTIDWEEAQRRVADVDRAQQG